MRINFIGRPIELDKLVYDEAIIFENKEEANKVIKGYRIFKGWQYIGNMLSFTNCLLIGWISKNKNYSIRTKIFIYAGGIVAPMILFYIYSHYTYWDIIRPIVLKCREREKEIRAQNDIDKEEFKIKYNHSLDIHKYIQQKIGIYNCVKEVLP